MSADRSAPECAMCGLGLQNWTPTKWVDGESYCGGECARLASAVDHSVRSPVDWAIERDHSLCGAEPCSDCR